MRVMIFRKDADGVTYPKKADAEAMDTAMVEIIGRSRVNRSAVIGHFMPTSRGRSAFARQTAIKRADLHHLADCVRNGVLTPAAERTLSAGWEVPADNLGRPPKNGERDWHSTGHSILLYVKDRIGQATADAGFHTVSPDGSDVSVIVTL